LRLNGCYGQPLHIIAELAPNVCVLSLQLYILLHQPKDGLQKAFSLWNITDLFLLYNTVRVNNSSEEISQIVARAIKEWTHTSLVGVKVCGYLYLVFLTRAIIHRSVSL
jgi:hypothetical protein